VKINGTGFVTGATATIGGVGPLATTFVSSSQLLFNPPSVTPGFGAYAVHVSNPSSVPSFQNNVFFNYFEALPAGVGTSLAAVANPSQPARLDVFVKGSDNGLWHTYTSNNDGSWTNWEGLGGTLGSAPAVISWQDGSRIDAFVRGSDGGLWHKWWDGAHWNGWEGLGGILSGAPAAVSWGPGRLDVFVRGVDNHLWHKWWDGSRWNGWEGLGGILTSDPAGVSWGPPDRRVGPRPAPRIDLFVRGNDNGLWHKWFDTSSWSGWEALGGTIGTMLSGPAVSATEVGDLEVFWLGTDLASSLWHLPYFNTWLSPRVEGSSSWTPSVWGFGVGTVSANILQGVDVLVVTTDGAIWHTNLPGAQDGFGARPRARHSSGR
jgi:hypothetical protein